MVIVFSSEFKPLTPERAGPELQSPRRSGVKLLSEKLQYLDKLKYVEQQVFRFYY